MTKAYYNENDPFAAQWLRNLISAGHIADGFVDERSITDVKVEDLDGFTQHHFFAGIGGWSYALRLAGWPDHKPVWTGSCPCQPFSAAGQRKGFADDRHLWPHFYRLIRQCRPDTVFGEQVASALGWLDLVSGDLEGEGYAVGSAIIGAHSVGAPHIRQRIYWVADSNGTIEYERQSSEREQPLHYACDDENRSVAFTGCKNGTRRTIHGPGEGIEANGCRASNITGGPSLASDMGHANEPRLQGRRMSGAVGGGNGDSECVTWTASPTHWSDCSWLPCIDGKSRPVEPGTFPLAHGIPNRVGRLRGYGNAIVPQVAQAFIEAYMEAC